MSVVKTTIADRSPEARYLRMVMIGRGLHDDDLALRAGLAVGTVRNILADSPLYPQAKAQIERALGAPVWTPHSKFTYPNHRSRSGSN